MSKSPIFYKLALSMLLSAHALVLSAQESHVPQNEVKVGVVLSGGGAKGFAHVGALKKIEEAGVKIDYIGGTSIGAMVGGLYASGWSTRQLDSIIRAINYPSVINDDFARPSRPFYDKIYGDRLWFRLPFQKFSLSLPDGLSKGQGVINKLAELTQHVHYVKDFEKLPIPFMCMTTNLVNGQREEMHQGYLPEVMRASGSFPSLFSPFEIDGKELVDGGILDNYPVQAVLDMGADIVIGVDIQDGLYKKGEMNSAAKVIEQISSFQMVQNSDEQKKLLDVNIRPDIKGYSVGSFEAVDSLVLRGERAGEMNMEALREIAELQGKPDNKREDLNPVEEVTIIRIRFEGNEDYTDQYISGKLLLKVPATLKYQDISEGINKIYATDNFKNVYYKINPTPIGNELVVKVIEKDVNQYLGFGWHYDMLYKSSGILNWRIKNLGLRNSFFDFDLIVGPNTRVRVEYFVDNGVKPGWGVNAGFTGLEIPVLGSLSDENQSRVRFDMQTNEWFANLYAQSNFREQQVIGLGIEYKGMRYFLENIQTGDNEEFFIQKGDFFTPYIYMKLDSRDDAFFPTRGTYYNLEARTVFFNGIFEQEQKVPFFVKFDWQSSFPLAKFLTIRPGAFLGANTKQVLPVGYQFNLGGVGDHQPYNYTEFYGLPFNHIWEYNGGQVKTGVGKIMKVSGELEAHFLRNHHVKFIYNYARFGESFNDVFSGSGLNGLGLSYAFMTFVGPIELTGTWSNDAVERFDFYFSVGFDF